LLGLVSCPGLTQLEQCAGCLCHYAHLVRLELLQQRQHRQHVRRDRRRSLTRPTDRVTGGGKHLLEREVQDPGDAGALSGLGH
jgi:hypothetical protein